jgi:hypothetical protein
MRGQNAYQLSFLDNPFKDLRRLKEFADKVKRPPKIIADLSGASPKKEGPIYETPGSSYFNLQAKYKNHQSASQGSIQISEFEIINFLRKATSTAFTIGGIVKLSYQFNINEQRLRALISSVVRERIGR